MQLSLSAGGDGNYALRSDARVKRGSEALPHPPVQGACH